LELAKGSQGKTGDAQSASLLEQNSPEKANAATPREDGERAQMRAFQLLLLCCSPRLLGIVKRASPVLSLSYLECGFAKTYPCCPCWTVSLWTPWSVVPQPAGRKASNAICDNACDGHLCI
jgi:hypothetical protein